MFRFRFPCGVGAAAAAAATSAGSSLLIQSSTTTTTSLVNSSLSLPSGSSQSFVTSHLLAPVRHFDSKTQTVDELGPFSRLKNITPIVGQPKPCTREGDWELKFHLSDKMDYVIETILKKENWSASEIKREKENFNAAKFGSIKHTHDRRAKWDTVEDFQRTPWYRRFRPNEGGSIPMVSIEMMKLLEKNLIPPSARGDPYAHLRKRHYEDTFHNEKYSEGNIQYLTRNQLSKYTPGSNKYGIQSRKDFLEFEKEYKRKCDGIVMEQHEAYNAWKTSKFQESRNENW